jgi:4-amino-4-deoxy-L-arabinose transferase-like glycosyltransferase
MKRPAPRFLRAVDDCRRAWIAIGVFVVAAALFMPTLGRPLGNGDEAVYAQIAREMATTRELGTLRWQGAPCLYRPPASVWPLALAVALGGSSERAVRLPLALEAALAAALLFLVGAERRGLAVGLAAAALFTTARLTLRYAAYIESEPLLIDCMLWAWLAWERTAIRPRAWYVFGLAIGAALFVKPIVGALPLVLLALRRPRPARLAALLGLAAAPSLPWIAWQWARHGHAFVDAFFVANLVGRSLSPMLRGSTPLYYPAMMLRTEGALALLFAVGIVHAVRRRDWPPLVWTLAGLVPFSLVASRYDYYALPAYPALALMTAGALVDVRRWLAVTALAIWAAWHLASAWLAPPEVADPDSGALAKQAGAAMSAGEPLFIVDQSPYSARWYADRRTVQLVFDAREYAETRRMLPAELILTRQEDYARILAVQPCFAIVPEVYAARLATAPTLETVATAGPYRLVRRR